MIMTDYATGLLSPWLRRKRILAVLPYIHGRLLDYGCGAGVLADFAGCNEYIGVDADEESLTIARQNHPGVRFQSELPDELYDTITLLAVLEYLPDRVASLKQLRRHLAPGGRLVITTPLPTINRMRRVLAALGLMSIQIRQAEDSMPDKCALERDATAANLVVEQYRRFLLGTNQLFVLRSCDSVSSLTLC
jgi:SAM-dependent methyltransferase